MGNEFSSVETLWSQFENVMGKDETAEKQGQGEEEEQPQQQQQQGSRSGSRGVKREAQSDVEEE